MEEKGKVSFDSIDYHRRRIEDLTLTRSKAVQLNRNFCGYVTPEEILKLHSFLANEEDMREYVIALNEKIAKNEERILELNIAKMEEEIITGILEISDGVEKPNVEVINHTVCAIREDLIRIARTYASHRDVSYTGFGSSYAGWRDQRRWHTPSNGDTVSKQRTRTFYNTAFQKNRLNQIIIRHQRRIRWLQRFPRTLERLTADCSIDV